jgi:hypothetical protein
MTQVLLSSEAGSSEYVHLAFSPDEKYIIAQVRVPTSIRHVYA